MSYPDPKTTLREFQEYFAATYEANHKIAARIGVTAKTFADWLTGDRQPMGKSLSRQITRDHIFSRSWNPDKRPQFALSS